MKVIGLTGGIGSGKSTVAGILRGFGAVCLDLDAVGHQVMRPGTVTYNRLVEHFGKEIVAADGFIDRSILGNIVFSDVESLTALNDIVHPAIDDVVGMTKEGCKLHKVPVLVLEAAAMLENNRAWQTDEIWVTVAPEKAVIKRLALRSGYSEEDSLARIRAQTTDEERTRLADVVIDTDCTLDELRSRVEAEWRRLITRL